MKASNVILKQNVTHLIVTHLVWPNHCHQPENPPGRPMARRNTRAYRNPM